MSKELYLNVEDLITKALDIILRDKQKLVPEHLHWQMGNFLSNSLNVLVNGSLMLAKSKGLLSEPDENNKEWLSLFVSS